MNASLRRRYEAIRAILAESPSETIATRHAIGGVIAELKNDPNKYGARAVALVAQALRRDETALYRYAHVAARWSTGDIERLAGRRNRRGEALSWSHFVELSAVASKREREALLERSVAESLSVRELSRLAAQSHRGLGEDAARRKVGRVERRVGDVEQLASELDELAGELVRLRATAATDGRLVERMAAVVERARAALSALVRGSSDALDRIGESDPSQGD